MKWPTGRWKQDNMQFSRERRFVLQMLILNAAGLPLDPKGRLPEQEIQPNGKRPGGFKAAGE